VAFRARRATRAVRRCSRDAFACHHHAASTLATQVAASAGSTPHQTVVFASRALTGTTQHRDVLYASLAPQSTKARGTAATACPHCIARERPPPKTKPGKPTPRRQHLAVSPPSSRPSSTTSASSVRPQHRRHAYPSISLLYVLCSFRSVLRFLLALPRACLPTAVFVCGPIRACCYCALGLVYYAHMLLLGRTCHDVTSPCFLFFATSTAPLQTPLRCSCDSATPPRALFPFYEPLLI